MSGIDFKLDINPDQINRAVVDAIIASSIGENIKLTLDKEVRSLMGRSG